MTDDIDIAKERAIADAATRGEWQCGTAGNSNLVSFNGDDIVGIAIVSSERNLTFIARARTLVPRLLDALEQARKELQSIRDVSDPDGELSPDSSTRDRMMHWCDSAGHLGPLYQRIERVAAERDALRAELERVKADLAKVADKTAWSIAAWIEGRADAWALRGDGAIAGAADGIAKGIRAGKWRDALDSKEQSP